MLRLAALFRRRPAPVPGGPADDRRKKVDEVWSVAPETKADEFGWYWMQHPAVRERINTLISGNPHVDAYGRLAQFLDEHGITKPLRACVSLGCGFGGLERDLATRGMIGEIDAYDLSEGAIAEARRLAAEQGLRSVRYHVADLDAHALPQAQFDAVFAHSSVHHVEKLEQVFQNVRRALKPGGVFHLNEFVGPTRFQWTGEQLELINDFLDTLPGRLLQTPQGPKPPAQRPTIEQMIAMDPTEAVRSSEIRDVLAEEFDIVEDRPFGGTLLHMGLGGIAQNFDPANPGDRAHLERFFDLEDRMMLGGTITSDFAVLTARPRSGRNSGTKTAARPPIPGGMTPTRRLRPHAGFVAPPFDRTVSKADTMLGTDDAHYLFVGQSALSIVERALGATEPATILDLPCGFGRVTRALRSRFPHAAITVSDLDRPGVDFSASQFGARAAYSVRDFRELDLGETYDLIWVGSLMTHLPAATTKQLFAALARHLTPGGTALITLQGPSIIPRLRETGYGLPPGAAEQVIGEFERTGFGYRDYVGGDELYGVSLTNDHYGISLTAEPWMRSALAESGLSLHAYEVQTWDNHHDVAVARPAATG